MKRARRDVTVCLAALCLLLTACGGEQASLAEVETAYTPAELMEAVCQSQGAALPALNTLTPGDEAFGDYLASYYQLAPEEVEDGAVRCAGGMEATELAVLRFTAETDMEAAEEALLAYQDARAGDFTGYLPEQAELVESGLVVIQGHWAALLLCPEPETARETFLQYFGPDAPEMVLPAASEPARPETPPKEDPENPEPPEEPEPNPPEESGGPEPPAVLPEGSPAAPPESAAPELGDYDGGAVLAAWRSGDAGGLSGKSLAVLEAAKAAIAQAVTEGMSDYEKELALHDWMLDWGRYDHGTLSHLPDQEAGADSDNPYGFLLEGAGICLGYASTFQLLMDMVGIECLTVEGTAHSGTADHAWNLVRLDGEWYGVDVTWDDPSTTIPVSEELAHRYFNVTSEFLRSNDHQWVEEDVPVAGGTAWAWE